jgi:SWIM zinc finger
MQDILTRLNAWSLKEAYYTNLKAFLSNVEIVKRVERAYKILTCDKNYEITYISDNPMTFTVHNTDGEGKVYIVIPSKQSCTCPDAERSILCKHRLAIKLIIDAMKLQREAGIAIEQQSKFDLV